MSIAKDGIGTLAAVLFFAILFTVGLFINGSILIKAFSALFWVFFLFSLYFFRDPERVIPANENAIVAPADGKIIIVRKVRENVYLKGPATQVSIFMSVFSVHVNRIPMSGVVGYFKYYPGKFLPAYREKASTDNEQTVIGIENGATKILFKQIAGIIARRVVCHTREGFHVKRGERFGMIKFGSRADIFLPENVEVTVNAGQKVKGGESIIGEIKSEH
ncbi:phosphatidylserine decarboxylase [bacterium BMS3Abin05]|nr:phosphatidylserine decarboxylase [bacterium BMS3Abin05]GBE26824.1 phosphatidylserine decarboxylase [bacterium BMS3Bbin03]HDK35588.1 phosphatidylserine decarboxylase family protein [Bacteroidota bacterium]HDL78740.1 phosphatidylserine decarboxylase family protein [Bacteroidota bacterium]HDZ13252.1 phosphatidylserine decarboxylase family protein [Bacteroidota bacterium]